MSDEEDDYLSDKFLVDSTPAASSSAKTYTARRKEAQRAAALKNEQNRRKSRRELEQESREEGLSKSLFERAKDEAEQGGGGGASKALAMMMKMGFQPGQSLGQPDAPVAQSRSPSQDPISTAPAGDGQDKKAPEPAAASQHRVNPLPLNEWTGESIACCRVRADAQIPQERPASACASVQRRPTRRSGSPRWRGWRRTARTPTSATARARSTRSAARRSSSGLRSVRARRSTRRPGARCARRGTTSTPPSWLTLDLLQFNVLWLNPANVETFPDGLVDALDDPDLITSLRQLQPDHSLEGRLRARMKADALQPVASLDDEGDEDPEAVHKEFLRKTPYSGEDIKEAVQFLRLTVRFYVRWVRGAAAE